MAAKLQGADIKNSTEIVAAGATIASLPTDDQVYISALAINKTLKQAIIDGDVGAGANLTLSNLTSPTAINQDLVPDSDFTRILGDATHNWMAHIGTAYDTSDNPAASLSGRELYDSVGNTIVQWEIKQLASGGVTKLDWSGTDVSLNTHKLTSVVDPASAQDAATKNYVDTRPVAPTIQKFLSSSGTYTTPTSPRVPLYIRVRMVGGGGGGGGGGQATGGNGGTGGNTTFGTSLLVANGGLGGTGGGTAQTSGGDGGTASLGTGPIGIALSGGIGSSGFDNNLGASASNFGLAGGMGASSALGGGAGGGAFSNGGGSGKTNTGGGAGGGSCVPTAGTANISGGGGGAGAFVDAIISSPAASYSYAVGSGGTAGTAGTNGAAGGAGGSGLIEVTEYYQ